MKQAGQPGAAAPGATRNDGPHTVVRGPCLKEALAACRSTWNMSQQAAGNIDS